MRAVIRLRSTRVRQGAVARVLVLGALVVAAAVVFAAPASASGPTSLGVSGWQVYSDTNIFSNPDGNQIHGDPGEYAAAPAIPAVNDSGWANCGASSPYRFSPYGGGHLCPSASTIGMAVGSILPGCWSQLNFTYFQALVSIPANTSVSSFSVNMQGADDGARVSLVNSKYPNGVTPPISIPVSSRVSSAEANDALRVPSRSRTAWLTSSRSGARTMHAAYTRGSALPTTTMVFAESSGAKP